MKGRGLLREEQWAQLLREYSNETGLPLKEAQKEILEKYGPPAPTKEKLPSFPEDNDGLD